MNLGKSTHLLVLFCLALFGCSSEHYIEGQVIDYETRQPVPGVKVTLQQSGWKFTDGVTWDHLYAFESTTDASGEFRVVYDVGTSAKLKAEKEGYVTFGGWFVPDSKVVLQIKSKNPDYVKPVFGILKLGIQKFQPFGWNFSKQQITFDPKEADVFPQFNSEFDRKNIEISVAGKGGLYFVSEEKLGVRFDHLVYADEAPETGYTRSARLEFDRKSAGVFFVRNYDGRHFAKVLFNSRSFGTEGSERDFKSGNWALMLEYVYNPKPSRNLRFEKNY